MHCWIVAAKLLKTLDDRWSLNIKICRKLRWLSSSFQTGGKYIIVLEEHTQVHMYPCYEFNTGLTNFCWQKRLSIIAAHVLNIVLSLISAYWAGYAGTGGRNRAPFVKKIKEIKWPPFCRWHWYSNKTWVKYVRHGQISNKAALIQRVAWCRTGDKLLPETMMAQYTDAFMQPSGSVC